jgi:hypothetical protein
LKSIAESCARQLRGWADSLQNSDIKGQRHLTDKTRQADDQKKRAASEISNLRSEISKAWHPRRKDAEERGLI